MKIFYEKDANQDLIKNKKVAIFGFGSQGHAHALNLKDSGVKELVVALREDSPSRKKAEASGLKVMSLSDAAEWADVAMILTPDELQSQIYKNFAVVAVLILCVTFRALAFDEAVRQEHAFDGVIKLLD